MEAGVWCGYLAHGFAMLFKETACAADEKWNALINQMAAEAGIKASPKKFFTEKVMLACCAHVLCKLGFPFSVYVSVCTQVWVLGMWFCHDTNSQRLSLEGLCPKVPCFRCAFAALHFTLKGELSWFTSSGNRTWVACPWFTWSRMCRIHVTKHICGDVELCSTQGFWSVSKAGVRRELLVSSPIKSNAL